jgi:hypothetical protein
MSASLGLITRVWSSVKEQIVQPVPQDVQVCEFYCSLKQCTLEVSGRCEIRPRAALTLIKSTAGSRPQWDGAITPAPSPTISTPTHAA